MPAYHADGELSLELDTIKISGWQTVRVTRGVERCPSDFDIALTEKYPETTKEVPVAPGQVCRVRIGKDLVLTGYVDRYAPEIEAESHTVRIMGRSACEDIVDSNCVWRSPVINSTTVRDIATKLCEPHGVTVRALAGSGPYIPQITVNLGETPYQVIERVARYGAMLVYDDTEGNLVLSTVGAEKMASGFVEGVNVLSASVAFSYDQRFGEYHGYLSSLDSLNDIGKDGNTVAIVPDPAIAALKRPDGKPRIRVMAVISEQPDGVGGYYAARRTKWEKARRYGRSQAVRVTADSWRDAKGKLWEPNYRVPVNIPSCKIKNLELVIGEVSYVRDERGTHAELVLMPAEAFEPEPAIINPFAALFDTGAPRSPGDFTVNPSSNFA